MSKSNSGTQPLGQYKDPSLDREADRERPPRSGSQHHPPPLAHPRRPVEMTKIYRYPGIQPFTEQQKDLFFGRDDDREQLLSLILLEKLTVLFGKSGYGKSSLLNAGIAPDLDKENRRGKRQYLPVFIRFHSRVGNEQYDWFDWFTFHLSQKLPIADPTEPASRAFLPRTLWGELKRRQTSPNQVFILIFDQFEEIFTYPKEQQETFKQQLADLLYADIPEYLEQHEDDHTPEEIALMSQKLDVKAVFSIRADRLSELDQLKDKLPAILNKRYELRALRREQAREALEKPAGLLQASYGEEFKSPVFSWQPAATEKVLAELSRDPLGRQTGIEAFQLQIVAQNIENRVIQGEVADLDGDGTPDVAVSDLPSIDRLYEDFYENALKQLSPSEQRKTQRLIEQGLIFEQDHQRINLHEKLIHRDFGVDAALLQKLTDLRLVRAEPSTSGGRNIELSHDSFVAPILAVAERRKKERRRKSLSAGGALLLLLVLGSTVWAIVPPKNADIIQQNAALMQQLDSIKVERNLEEEAKSTVLKYFACVNNHDISCLSAISADTMEQYHQVKNLPRQQREKLEQDYFRRHSTEKVAEVKDVMVERRGDAFEVTVSTVYFYEKRGSVPVIFKIKLNRALRIFYLRSFIAAE